MPPIHRGILRWTDRGGEHGVIDPEVIALVREALVVQEAGHDHARFLQLIEAFPGRRELVSEGGVLGLHRSGSKTEFDPSVAPAVDRGHRLGDQAGGPESHGPYQAADPDSGRFESQRGEGRHRLVAGGGSVLHGGWGRSGQT